jgi:transcriptional regulator with XRE-family HTH domain
MIGDELRKAREAAGLSQEQLGFKANIHRTYVSQLERDIKSPTLDVFFRLCDAVGMSPASLISRIDRHRRR